MGKVAVWFLCHTEKKRSTYLINFIVMAIRTSYFQCRPQCGIFVLAHKMQLLERRKLLPSNQGKSTSFPLAGRKSTLQHKLGTKATELEVDNNISRVKLEELQAALAQALRENASLKDNQDQVVRLEKLLTSQKLLNDSLQTELVHVKSMHVIQIKNCHEESHHLGATIEELEAVNRVLNSTLAELSSQPLDHHRLASDVTEIRRLQSQCADLQEKHQVLCDHLEAEKERHRATKKQLAEFTTSSAAQQPLEDALRDYVQKLKAALEETENMRRQKDVLEQELYYLKSREQERIVREQHIALREQEFTLHENSLLQHVSSDQSKVQTLNNQLSERQAENEDLSFALKELTMALENAKEHAATMSHSAVETQQAHNDQLSHVQIELDTIKAKYDQTANELIEQREASAKQVSQLQIIVSERDSALNQLELSNLRYKETLTDSQQRVTTLQDEMEQLKVMHDFITQQLENQSGVVKELEEKQHIIDQLLGDIAELQTKICEYRDHTDLQLEEINSLRLQSESKNAEYQQLQEAYKQLETECLKLMDEIIVDSKDNDTPDSDAPNNFSYALQLSHKRMKALETQLSRMQSEMDAKLNTLTQQHTKAIKTKDVTITKLNNELSDIEHLVENKIFREAELEEQLAREMAYRKKSEQDVLDLQVERNIPFSPQSDHGGISGYQVTSEAAGEWPHYTTQHQTAKFISESYCGICDGFDHDTINCKRVASQDMIQTYPKQASMHHNQPVSISDVNVYLYFHHVHITQPLFYRAALRLL
jgi:chromosome segregation ATPase